MLPALLSLNWWNFYQKVPTDCWSLGSLVWCPSIHDAAIHYRRMACGWFLLIFCSPRLAKSSLPFQGSASVKATEMKLPKTTSPTIKKRMKMEQHFLDSDSSLHSKHAQLYLQEHPKDHSTTVEKAVLENFVPANRNLTISSVISHPSTCNAQAIAARATQNLGEFCRNSPAEFTVEGFEAFLETSWCITGKPDANTTHWTSGCFGDWYKSILPCGGQVSKVWILVRNDVTNCIHLHSYHWYHHTNSSQVSPGEFVQFKKDEWPSRHEQFFAMRETCSGKQW